MQIANWVKTHVEQRTVTRTGRSTDGLHFAGIANVLTSGESYETVLCMAHKALSEARAALVRLGAERENWPLVTVPLGNFSAKVTPWDDAMWREAGVGSEGPALILMPGPLRLDSMAECYYRPVHHPAVSDDICILYTSYRSPELLVRGIKEYYNSLNLYYRNV